MRKSLIVARSELGQAVRSKAFLITLIAMPVLMVGSIVLQRVLDKRVDTKPRTVAVIDLTGKLVDGLRERNDARNLLVAGGDGRAATGAPYEIEALEDTAEIPVETQIQILDTLLWSKSNEIRNGTLFAVVVIPADAISSEGMPKLRYYSNDPNYLDLMIWMQVAISDEVRAQRLKAIGADPEVVARLSTPLDIDALGLLDKGADGVIKPAEPVSRLRTFGVPMILMFIVYMVVMTSAPQLLNSVLEEKMSRISEVLLGSVTPFELMLGKLLGAAGVALILGTLYVVGGLGAAFYLGYGMIVPVTLLPWLAVFLVLALFFFGSFYIAIGAACSDLKDAQSLMMPVILLTVFPVMMASAVIREPNGTLATAASMLPPATPFLMLIRLASQPGPPAWQVLVAVLLTVVATVGCVLAAGKIFRVGVLAQGKSASFTQMIKWVLAR